MHLNACTRVLCVRLSSMLGGHSCEFFVKVRDTHLDIKNKLLNSTAIRTNRLISRNVPSVIKVHVL